jgi:hypothetical protein
MGAGTDANFGFGRGALPPVDFRAFCFLPRNRELKSPSLSELATSDSNTEELNAREPSTSNRCIVATRSSTISKGLTAEFSALSAVDQNG